VSSKFIHGLPFPRNGDFPASRPGPVQASASEPEGSLDGWPRCKISQTREWQAAFVPLLSVLASSPRFHSHFFEACIGCVPVGSANQTGAAI